MVMTVMSDNDDDIGGDDENDDWLTYVLAASGFNKDPMCEGTSNL